MGQRLKFSRRNHQTVRRTCFERGMDEEYSISTPWIATQPLK